MPSHAAPESIKGRLLTCKAAYSGGTVPVLHRVSILSHKAPLTSLFNYHVLILALITNKVNNFLLKILISILYGIPVWVYRIKVQNLHRLVDKAYRAAVRKYFAYAEYALSRQYR